MLSLGVTVLMTIAAFMLAVYLGLKGRWLLAAVSLICFFVLISSKNVLPL